MTAADNQNDAGPAVSSTAAANKLPPIPNGTRIQKRPLMRCQRAASATAPVVYVSSATPFMSAVKRVQKHLDASLRRATAASKMSLHARVEALKRRNPADTGATAVTVAGTGRAVDKTLRLAGWFEQRGDCVVELRTATVGTIDDVRLEGDDGADDESRVRRLSCLEVVVRLKQ